MIWVQFMLSDGSKKGYCSQRVSDDDLAAIGKGQVEYDGSFYDVQSVDITQNPPVVILYPPAPSPAPVG